MKCIKCKADSKFKDRTYGRCPQCSQQFAFEPKTGDKITDLGFQMMIERVSSGGTVRFTARHLYYEALRHARRGRHLGPWICGGLAVGAGLAGITWSGFFFGPMGILAFLAISQFGSKLGSFSYANFLGLLERWQSAHGTPKGLIVRKEPALGEPARQALPSDIQHYSFDRAVITDNPETVDLLLANNFHFENNCAVLTSDGYPEYAFEVVRGMLQKNPEVAVYVLHDATPQGCHLAKLIAGSGWFQKTARIVDVGIGPEHAGPFKSCWQPPKPPVGPPSDLPASSAKWLERHSLELAVVRPEQVIKRLFRAMSNTGELPDQGGFFIDAGAFSSDASSSDGGGDSFG